MFGEAVFNNLDFFVQGYVTTVILFVASLAVALVIGIIGAALRVWGTGPLPIAATAYVEFIRNTPLLVQLFFYATFLSQANLIRSPVQAAIVGLAVYTGAYVTEVVRSGILSVDARQLETARSLGLSQVQALRYVVLPQAVRSVIPPLGNISIALVKNTAVASAIAAPDLLQQGGVIASRTFRLDPYAAIIVGYLSLTLTLSFLIGRLERRSAFSR
ncbi:MAG: amino acid ABC transporter permease [Chloroflexi bacterium]|nr:amino acid ABC transporter permease [Chloroflexota bacterium]